MGVRAVSPVRLSVHDGVQIGSEPRMKIELFNSEADAERWQAFVNSHPGCTNYHRWNWKTVIEKSFDWPTFYLAAIEGKELRGILPIVWQKSWLFGSFLTSMPFLNAGGIVAESDSIQQALLHEGIGLAKRIGAKHLELRQREDHQFSLPARTNKVTVVLSVEQDSERMWKALSTKMRTKIRKSMSFGLSAEFGGLELLDDFYRVFSKNMRDLGTPVYGRNFFSEILRTFPLDTHLCVVRREGVPVATSFLSGFRDRIEAVWSSSDREYLSLKPNFYLYWNLLCFAGQRGYRLFDFGRSSKGSGTHEFKLQWGGKTIPLHWVYWLSEGRNLPQINPENPKYRMSILAWRRLPLAVTKAIGPRIGRCLP